MVLKQFLPISNIIKSITNIFRYMEFQYKQGIKTLDLPLI